MANTDFFNDQEKIKPMADKDFNRLFEQKAKEKGHQRQQKLMDSLTSIACIAIYIVPTVLALLYAAVMAHKAYVGEWQALEDSIIAMLIPVTTYLAGILSKNVLPSRHSD